MHRKAPIVMAREKLTLKCHRSTVKKKVEQLPQTKQNKTNKKTKKNGEQKHTKRI